MSKAYQFSLVCVHYVQKGTIFEASADGLIEADKSGSDSSNIDGRHIEDLGVKLEVNGDNRIGEGVNDENFNALNSTILAI